MHQPSVRWAVLSLQMKPTRPQVPYRGPSRQRIPNVADHTSDPALEAAGGRRDGLAAARDEDRPKDPKSAPPPVVDVPEGSTIDADIVRRQKELKTIGEGKAALEARQRAADAAKERKPWGGPAYKRPFGVPDNQAKCDFTDPESRL